MFLTKSVATVRIASETCATTMWLSFFEVVKGSRFLVFYRSWTMHRNLSKLKKKQIAIVHTKSIQRSFFLRAMQKCYDVI